MDANHDRITSLDGLRGLAIFMVFLRHTILLPEQGYDRLKAAVDFGHLGVDLFFVLSGFLITGILFGSKNRSHYFRNFYARRSLRIFPLYYFYLTLYYVAAVHFKWINFGEAKAAKAAADLHWAWFYGTNIEIARTGSFITASLNQFWTLAIEEHFYLVWPLLVFFLNRRSILLATLLISVGSLLLRTFMDIYGVSGFTVLTFTLCRVDSFAIGGAFSILLTMSEWRRKLAVWTGPGTLLFGILVLLSFFSGNLMLFSSIGYTLTSFFFAFAIGYLVLHKDTFPALFFSRNWPRKLGKYSYALYIFHFPILIFVDRKLPLARLTADTHSVLLASALIVGLVAILSLGVAMLSWHLYEKRFIALKRFFPEASLRQVELPSEASHAA